MDKRFEEIIQKNTKTKNKKYKEIKKKNKILVNVMLVTNNILV